MLNQLRTLPQYIVPQQLLSRFCGCLADNHIFYRPFIRWFIKHFKVNMQEALHEDITAYHSFNDFFTRRLKPNVRSIDKSDNAIISPVDGIISQIGHAQAGQLIQAKGKSYSVLSLLGGNEAMARPFLKGAYATLYLSPKDYHRIHFPFEAEVEKMVYIPGKLFAVKPLTAQTVPNLFARNERLVIYLKTPLGKLAFVMVGAMIVASMATTWGGEIKRHDKMVDWTYDKKRHMYQKADELGYFKLGSTVILLFDDTQTIDWSETINAPHKIKLGERIGSYNN
jgi:phosphatidylserine decarboxylase